MGRTVRHSATPSSGGMHRMRRRWMCSEGAEPVPGLMTRPVPPEQASADTTPGGCPVQDGAMAYGLAAFAGLVCALPPQRTPAHEQGFRYLQAALHFPTHDRGPRLRSRSSISGRVSLPIRSPSGSSRSGPSGPETSCRCASSAGASICSGQGERPCSAPLLGHGTAEPCRHPGHRSPLATAAANRDAGQISMPSADRNDRGPV